MCWNKDITATKSARTRQSLLLLVQKNMTGEEFVACRKLKLERVKYLQILLKKGLILDERALWIMVRLSKDTKLLFCNPSCRCAPNSLTSYSNINQKVVSLWDICCGTWQPETKWQRWCLVLMTFLNIFLRFFQIWLHCEWLIRSTFFHILVFIFLICGVGLFGVGVLGIFFHCKAVINSESLTDYSLCLNKR